MPSVRFAVGLLLCVPGCTLVSGWSDLQNGVRPGVDAGADAGPVPSGTPDAGPQDAASVPTPDASSSSPDSAPPVNTAVACGSTHCAAGQGCCAAIFNGGTCQATSQGCNPPNTFVTCSDSAACAVQLGHSAQCCSTTSSGFPTVGCRTNCATGDQIVCDPTSATSDCPAGKTCKPSADGFAFDTCQ